METLQKLSICHRELSLEAIAMNGDNISITESRYPVRFQKSKGVDDEDVYPHSVAHDIDYGVNEHYTYDYNETDEDIVSDYSNTLYDKLKCNEY